MCISCQPAEPFSTSSVLIWKSNGWNSWSNITYIVLKRTFPVSCDTVWHQMNLMNYISEKLYQCYYGNFNVEKKFGLIARVLWIDSLYKFQTGVACTCKNVRKIAGWGLVEEPSFLHFHHSHCYHTCFSYYRLNGSRFYLCVIYWPKPVELQGFLIPAVCNRQWWH